MLSTCETGGEVCSVVRDRWFLLKADIDIPDDSLRVLRSEDSENDEPDPSLVARAVSKVLQVQITLGASPPLRGTFRWVVPVEIGDGRRAVVKIHRLRHSALTAGLLREAALADHLVRLGIPLPMALAVDTSCEVLPTEFGVFERFDGSRLSAHETDEPAVEKGLHTLGAYLRRLHSVRLPGAGPVYADTDVVSGNTVLRGAESDWPDFVGRRLGAHLKYAVEAGYLVADEADRARALFADASLGERPSGCLQHGDPGGPNVILNADGEIRGLVDWEDALVGDPLFELASCACFHPERRWKALFEGYGGRADVDSAERGYFWLYFFRIALARTVMRHRFAIPDIAGREPAAHRIRYALNRIENVTGGTR